MKLEEQFRAFSVGVNDSIEGNYEMSLAEKEVKELVEIAENFVIGFAKWFCTHDHLHGTMEQLLEIYKKTL